MDAFKDENYENIVGMYRKIGEQTQDPKVYKKFEAIYKIISKGKDKLVNVREMGICLGKSGEECKQNHECSSFNCESGKCTSGAFVDAMKLVGSGTLKVLGFLGKSVVSISVNSGNFIYALSLQN